MSLRLKNLFLIFIIICMFAMLVGCNSNNQENEQFIEATSETIEVETNEHAEEVTEDNTENTEILELEENTEPITEELIIESVTEQTEPATEPATEETKETEPKELETSAKPEEPSDNENESELISLGRFKLTAYCACSKCCGKSDGITASGTIATQGRTIAADPSVIPYGTVVIINGNEYVAEDCGGAVKNSRIDIFFNSHQDALNFGVQYAEVYIKK